MALLINDNHILYCHMEAARSRMLGHSYFSNPDYLVVKAWICTILLHLDIKIYIGPFKYQDTKFFSGMAGHSLAVPCHHGRLICLIIL